MSTFGRESVQLSGKDDKKHIAALAAELSGKKHDDDDDKKHH